MSYADDLEGFVLGIALFTKAGWRVARSPWSDEAKRQTLVLAVLSIGFHILALVLSTLPQFLLALALGHGDKSGAKGVVSPLLQRLGRAILALPFLLGLLIRTAFPRGMDTMWVEGVKIGARSKSLGKGEGEMWLKFVASIPAQKRPDALKRLISFVSRYAFRLTTFLGFLSLSLLVPAMKRIIWSVVAFATVQDRTGMRFALGIAIVIFIIPGAKSTLFYLLSPVISARATSQTLLDPLYRRLVMTKRQRREWSGAKNGREPVLLFLGLASGFLAACPIIGPVVWPFLGMVSGVLSCALLEPPPSRQADVPGYAEDQLVWHQRQVILDHGFKVLPDPTEKKA